MEEGGDVAAAGRGLDEASSGRAVLELVRGHVTVTDRAQRAQVVDVARATAVRHRHDVVDVPELTRTHTQTHIYAPVIGVTGPCPVSEGFRKAIASSD